MDAAVEMALVAVQPIRLDGRDHAPGASFFARPDVAEWLLESGAAEVPETPPDLPPAVVDEAYVPKTQKKPYKASKSAGVGEGITEAEKIAPRAVATPGNGGIE